MKNNYLISTGGTGAEFVKHNFNFNRSIHARHFKVPKNDRFVYIFAHPYNVLLSHGRRGFIGKGAIGQLQGDVVTFRIHRFDNLREYLNVESDCFMLGNHFNNYYSQETTGLFIKYEAFIDKLDVSMRSFGIKRVHDQKVVNRKSNYKNIDKQLLEKLKERHGRYADHFNSLPSVFTNEIKDKNYYYNERWD